MPQVKVYVWTGYVYEELLHNNNKHIQMLLDATDVLIDGPYVEAMKDLTLPMRGSSNQRIIDLTNFIKNDIIKENE